MEKSILGGVSTASSGGATENWHYRWKHMRMIESEKTVKLGHLRYQTTRHKLGNQKMMSIWLSESIVLNHPTPLIIASRQMPPHPILMRIFAWIPYFTKHK